MRQYLVSAKITYRNALLISITRIFFSLLFEILFFKFLKYIYSLFIHIHAYINMHMFIKYLGIIYIVEQASKQKNSACSFF